MLDGDDTPGSTTGPLVKTKDGFQGVVQLGRTYGDATFELLDDNDEVITQVTTQVLQKDNRFMELLPSTGRLLVCIENDTENSLASNLGGVFIGGKTDDDRVASISSLNELPQIGIAYESCESLFLLSLIHI